MDRKNVLKCAVTKVRNSKYQSEIRDSVVVSLEHYWKWLAVSKYDKIGRDIKTGTARAEKGLKMHFVFHVSSSQMELSLQLNNFLCNFT
jgi:hypothetical protein